MGNLDPTSASDRSSKRAALSVIHWGSFSGTVEMIEPSIRTLADASFHDLGSLTRRPALLPARALEQARAIGRDWPWHKTVGWSRAIQGEILRNGWLVPETPTVFFQTLAAPVLPPDYPYVIYTDRVGREGALGSEEFRSSWGPGWDEREEQFLNRASSVFVMGPSTKDALETLYGTDPDKIHVVGAGPGSSIGPITRAVRAPRRLLFVGTAWRLKGGPEVVEAFRSLKQTHPGLELQLVGSDPEDPLPEGAVALGRVPRSRMPELFAEADLFLVPTHMEALGYSLLESLMQGLPSIGSTVGNQGWLIDDAGRTVTPGDVSAIVDAVNDVLRDYDSYKARAVARAAELRDTMTWDRVASALVDHISR